MALKQVLLYYARLGSRWPEDEFARRAARLPPELSFGLGRYLRWQDRQARLCSWLLLQRALRELGQDPDRLRQLERNPWGRPRLPGGPEFNLSHAGELVACAVAAGLRLGVDVEQVKRLDLQDFRSCFQAGEWAGLQADPDPLGRFFWLWTAKESVCKAEGQGLSIPLAEVRLSPGGAWCRGRRWWLTPLGLDADHPGHLACDQAAVELLLREQTWEEEGRVGGAA